MTWGKGGFLHMPDTEIFKILVSFSLFIQSIENCSVLLCSLCEKYFLLAFVLNYSISY